MKKILIQGKIIVLLFIFLFLFEGVHSSTRTSTTAGGNWTTSSTWVGGVVPVAGDAVFIATSGTGAVNIAAKVIQTAAGSVTVNNGAKLTTSKGTITFGSLIINSGGTVTMYRQLTVLGATNIIGTINFGSTRNGTVRNMRFTGMVTINAGGVWNETTTGAAATFDFSGGITNNGTFTAQTPIHTFSTNAQTLNGNFSIPNVTITGITLTNNNTLIIGAALIGNGGLTNSATGVLNLGGTATINTLTTNSIGNTVNYTGAVQTAKVTTYHNLTLSGTGTKTFATSPTVNGTLLMEGTASVIVSTGVVTYGPAATLQYNKPAAYTATTEEWISPFTATGGVIITNSGTVTAPSGRTIGNGSSLNLQNGILAAGSNITMASTSTINRSEGSMTGTLQGTGIYNVSYTGNSKSVGPELAGSGLHNVSVNMATTAATLTSSALAFKIGNNLTVSQGNMILAATDADYTITNDLIVSANGTLTHSVNWDAIPGRLLRVNGNIAIDGKFAYTVRSHVQMGGVNKTIRTGPAPSALSILTLAITSGTISASGLVTVNDNFWASFNAIGGTFATSAYTVYAKATLLNAGGTILVNGGTLNVTGGLLVGTSFTNGSVTLSSGTLNSDFINIGEGALTGTFTQTGGTANIFGNLLINPACSYTCANSPATNIGGNFVNNGTYTKATETFTLSGNTPVSISGSSNTDLNNLVVTNTGGVTTQLGLLSTNNLSVAVGSRFTIDPLKFVTVNGALTLNDSLILKSTSAGTASLVTKGSVTGSKARVERYINGNPWSWHFLSSPVSTQALSGSFTPASSGYDFYMWYEPLLTWVNSKNTTTTPTWNDANLNTSFLPGRGYLVAYEATNTTKNFSGLLNNNNMSYTLTRDGSGTFQYFNLVGNPYPCSIDWEATASWDRSNLDGTQKSYWIWNDNKGNYGTYITGGSGTNGVTRYISSGQGFLVLASAAGPLTMTSGVKVHSAQAYLKSEDIANNELRLRLTCDVNAYSDEAIVEFNNNATNEGSMKFNSMYTNAPELWSVKNGQNYSINYLDELSSADIVPLTVKAGVAGTYTLSASQTESFGSNSTVSLEDRLAGIYTSLSTSPTYTFKVNEPSTIVDRFFLHFEDFTGIPNSVATKHFNMYADNGILNIKPLHQQSGKIAVFDMLGRTIATGRIEAGSTTHINLNGNTGVYIVSIHTSNGISNTKILVK